MVKTARNGMVSIVPDRCDFCGICVAVCPVDCIELSEFRLRIDNNVCTLCMNCIHCCPVEALVLMEHDMVDSGVVRD